ncbi:MAG: hypothetical protein ABIM99_00600 [Candidatus Dojkabacteria bacterium]
MEGTVKETTTVTQDPVGNVTSRTVRSGYNVFSGDFFISKVNQIIFALVSIINLFILFRFILLLLGANQTGFVTMLINVTNFFVAPFQGIFPSPVVEGSYVEFASVLAIIVWFILAYVIAVVVSLFSNSTEEVV